MISDGNGVNGVGLFIIIGSGVLLIVAGILLLAFFNKRGKKVEANQPQQVNDEKWVNALGGKDNVNSLEAKGSRLIVMLKDNKLINKDELHELGVVSVISGQDKITLVLKEKAENIQNLLQ